MRYIEELTPSSSPSSFISLQLRGAELTTSFEDDALLVEETSVASDARGFLRARSRVFKAFASARVGRGSRVSDFRFGAIENG